MNAIRIAVIVVLLFSVRLCCAEVWQSAEVAAYTAGHNIKTNKEINYILTLEVVGPPRSVDGAKGALVKYAQESVDMAMLAALSAFNGTPGDLSTKTASAIGQFKATIVYRASINSAFRSIARFDLRIVSNRTESDMLTLRYHNPQIEITKRAGKQMEGAFPSERSQIKQLEDACIYISKKSNPDFDFKGNSPQLAQKLQMPETDVLLAKNGAQLQANNGGIYVNERIVSLTKRVPDAISFSTGEKVDHSTPLPRYQVPAAATVRDNVQTELENARDNVTRETGKGRDNVTRETGKGRDNVTREIDNGLDKLSLPQLPGAN
ncbi:hypothetical protein [Caballeronia sp. NCTM1]|uniref:hypothetical protein n=1 Tax=Caballeronia sp. NCTM1 TaxID=2921753 RepID=UPI0020293241|nr:hypothetical protein [Caballeronia sp. NCTM1]